MQNIHAKNDEGLLVACQKGHAQIVRFLTASEELKQAGHEWVRMADSMKFGFIWVCQRGHVEVVRALSGIDDSDRKEPGHVLCLLQEKPTILKGLERACLNHHWEVVRCLVWECKIEKTPEVEDLMDHHPMLRDLFRIREEQALLSQTWTHESVAQEDSSHRNKKEDPVVRRL